MLNASNTEKDINWIQTHLEGECTCKDISDEMAQIAIQGPNTKDLIEKLCNMVELPQKYYTFTAAMNVADVECLVSRTGYTGEFGYELYMKKNDAATVWSAFLELGAIPCGLGARDTLRLEAAMPLYGHELSDTIHICSTNLNFAIKPEKETFIGKDAYLNPPTNAPTRVGFKVIGRGIVRGDETIYLDGVEVGYTTSGTHCPYLGAAYAMGYVNHDVAKEGTSLMVEVRGRKIEVEVVKLPFYKK